MTDDTDDAIRARAYEIWESRGRPIGEDEAHWHQAKREFATAQGADAPEAEAPAAPPEKPKRRAAATAPKSRPEPAAGAKSPRNGR